jgi:hypothetical protein
LLNIANGKDPLTKPVGGRVVGVGVGAPWKNHLPDVPQTQGRRTSKAAIIDKEIVDTIKRDVRVEDRAKTKVQVKAKLHAMFPAILAHYKAYVQNGEQGEFVLPE